MAAKSLIDALHEKYTHEELCCIEIYVPKSAPQKTETGSLILPKELTINGAQVTCAGDEAELAKLCKDVTELDVAKNNISDWEEVFKMIFQMPSLRFLNVSHNPLSEPLKSAPEEACRNIKITELVLNGTSVTWSSVKALLHAMPGVQELHLSLNKFGHIDSCICDTNFPDIQQLHINGNDLSNWTDICHLGLAFPNLQNLVMIENPMSQFEDEAHTREAFPCLKNINISNTGIANWNELEKLNWFPALTEVRVQEIPWLQCMEEKERRQFVISYLPKVVKLNGSPVYPEEREDAERALIRHYLDEENKPARASELEEVHSKPSQLADLDFTPDDHVRMTVYTSAEKWKVVECA